MEPQRPTTPTPQQRIAIISAEFKGLAQRGGLGDVVRDLSLSLADQDKDVSVLIPYYDVIDAQTSPLTSLDVDFAGRSWRVGVYFAEIGGVTIYLLRNDFFFGGQYGDVYVDSSRYDRGPFEDDAKRFAFFSTAALDYMQTLHRQRPFSILHAHDWHTGSMFLSLRFDSRYNALARDIKTVFTIHNLDYQGVRPFAAEQKNRLVSYADWFPGLYQLLRRHDYVKKFSHPGAAEPCFNFMRTAIQLADNLTTVSPTYAKEILKADDPQAAFLGGRGLEKDLRRAYRQGRLHGILNGIDYRVFDPSQMTPGYDVNRGDHMARKSQHKRGLLAVLRRKLSTMPNLADREALLAKISELASGGWMQKPLVILCSRMASQKVSLLMEPQGDTRSVAVDQILNKDLNAIFLGRGELEGKMSAAVNRHRNGLMIAGFDAEIEKDLYSAGDLFLMPSDFEPCGVSQMKAMRFGCLPIVHHIGGLRDTVTNEETGFSFRAPERGLRRERFVSAVGKAVKMCAVGSSRWHLMQKKAMLARFEWKASTQKYLALYQGSGALAPVA